MRRWIGLFAGLGLLGACACSPDQLDDEAAVSGERVEVAEAAPVTNPPPLWDEVELPPLTTTTTTTAPPATTPPTVAQAGSVAPSPAPVTSRSVWDDLADCESGNGVPGSGTANWHINTGNGYYGGIQFSLRSWKWVGGTGYPHEHSRETQIEMGERLLARQGWGAWPACSRKMGLR